jgi:GT2 family glycosyltransferase
MKGALDYLHWLTKIRIYAYIQCQAKMSKKKYAVSGSIVLYKNDSELLKQTIDSFLKTTLSSKLYLVDNSPTDSLKEISMDPRIEYIFNNGNLGFGKGHNVALRKSVSESEYHLVLNPDVTFEAGTLEKLYDFTAAQQEIGLAIPKVLSFEGELQYVCKRLPQPLDLIVRRFGSGILHRFFDRRLRFYEMRDKDYSRNMEAPSLSGCFMYIKTEALEKIGLFDERFFMYMEDIDLSRRIHSIYKNIYCPDVTIYHGHARESYKSARLLKIHLKSAVKYFNKWGWVIDRERTRINRTV